MKAKQRQERPVIQDEEELLNYLINDYTTIKQQQIIRLHRRQMDKEAFLLDAEKHIKTYPGLEGENNQLAEKTMQLFEQYVFGYFRITPLIEDMEISDIRCIAYDNIRIKKNGIRMASDIRFRSPEEYRSFIETIATKNQVGISNLNAIQRFTDVTSSSRYILRFTVCMPLVNTYDEPYLSIRKVPKDFPELPDLIQKGMMTEETAEMLRQRFRDGSMLICGGNSSGKTTILNALKETLPENKSVLITQQADELTTKRHPDTMFLHSLPGTGESKVSYDLKDISIAGLTMDVDYFIVGEIKGSEAMYLLNAAYTGQICAATIHAPGADKAIDKVVDYAMYESRYTREELLKMMSCFQTIVFMKDYKVQQIYEVRGWNPKTKELDYLPLYERR